MKIRLGFVSNSSSSSFCIYGTFVERHLIDTDPVLQAMVDSPDDPDIKNFKDAKEVLEDDWYFLEKLFDFEIHSPEGCDGIYIGAEWSSVKDDETGRQFKDRIEAEIKEYYPQAKFGTHSESWYD